MTGPTLAETLNQTCDCVTLDDAALDHALSREAEGLGLASLVASHPHLFSRSAVFVDRSTADAIASIVAAVERVVALPEYQRRVLEGAPPAARVPTRARGAFLGFDFHLTTAGPQLIEINTNAGGGLLNAILRRAQRACCEPVEDALAIHSDASPGFFSMIRDEWQLARGDRPLRRIAIVDDAPESQYLYPEFLVFRALSEARGVPALICDARELVLENDTLVHRGEPIDLVYNRLTDFGLTDPEHAMLAEAFLRDVVVVTPHPRAYELYADKRRMAVFSDPDALTALGVSAEDRALLTQHIPRTRVVTAAERERLWQERKHIFFKPATGYGSKATYRGDKITKRMFDHVLEHPYVAQDLVPPSVRQLHLAGESVELKIDVRVFEYAGRVQLYCARLYRGQTTNFREAGSGFAPVYVV